ncbi:PepSY domain-containing protein [Crenobacter sp. SG2305]|uniref:PepSY domain-containing protein n=1 Tax=Crenobacter oryzisoli TaxID=3056844 RepID=UPI0025AAA1C9|nr:PepSY domain-containing protein [Crenobacter sp. SG2305]MDN0084960.1 PepSY domain-containing protein [Crenobacter sp. SG2305]
MDLADYFGPPVCATPKRHRSRGEVRVVMRPSWKQVGFGLAAIIAAAAVSGGAWYGEMHHEQQEHQALSTIKLSLSQAIDKATAAAGGQAVAAKLKLKDGRPLYKVTLQNGAQRSEVQIDAQSGATLGVNKEDADD